MNIIRFNTGRMYGADGQRIAATQLSDGRVFFADVTRGIDYVTKSPCSLEQGAIMSAYDSGECSAPFWGSQGHEYAMTQDALNELRAAARSL